MDVWFFDSFDSFDFENKFLQTDRRTDRQTFGPIEETRRCLKTKSGRCFSGDLVLYFRILMQCLTNCLFVICMWHCLSSLICYSCIFFLSNLVKFRLIYPATSENLCSQAQLFGAWGLLNESFLSTHTSLKLHFARLQPNHSNLAS